VPRTEALKHIFVRALGFKPDEFHGATPGFRGNPTVLFKTKEIFNIDERLAGKSFFQLSEDRQDRARRKNH
jgi:hypothetical protein